MTTKDTISDASRALSQIHDPFSLAEQQRLVQDYEASERSYANLIQEKTRQVQRLMQSIDVSVSELRRVRIIKANALEVIKRQEICGMNGNVKICEEGWSETDGPPRDHGSQGDMEQIIDGDHGIDVVESTQPMMERFQVLQAEVMGRCGFGANSAC